MESAIKSLGNAKICAVYAHNDDMMIGAIQAMKEAGLHPGKDVLTVSIDGVPDIFKAMADGRSERDGRAHAGNGRTRARYAYRLQERRQGAAKMASDADEALSPGHGGRRIRAPQEPLLS